MERKSYKQWLKDVENHIVNRGYSEEFADAIAMCVRGFYFNEKQYTDPVIAANRGIYSPPYKIN